MAKRKSVCRLDASSGNANRFDDQEGTSLTYDLPGSFTTEETDYTYKRRSNDHLPPTVDGDTFTPVIEFNFLSC